MPLKRCMKERMAGFRWGDKGICYTGPGAREKALKQGRAVEASKKRIKK